MTETSGPIFDGAFDNLTYQKHELPEIDWERMFKMTADVAAGNLVRAEEAEAKHLVWRLVN